MTKEFTLTRGGQEVFRGTEVECHKYILRRHSYSFAHALRHEGYRMDMACGKNGRAETRALRDILLDSTEDELRDAPDHFGVSIEELAERGRAAARRAIDGK